MDAFEQALARLTATWPVGTVAHDVRTHAGTTRVLTVPDGGRALPLLLLPGGGSTGASWAPVARRTTGPLHAVDLPGDAGAHPTEARLSGPGDLHRWLDGVAAGLGLDRFALAGHSYGAWVATSYALARPERVGALTLVTPSQCFAGLAVRYVARALPLLVRPSEKRAEAFLAWETGGADLGVAAEVYGAAAGRRWPGVVPPRRPSASALGRLAMPVDLVLADGDRSHRNDRVRAVAERRVPYLRTTVVPGTTHHTITVDGAETLARLLAPA